MINDGINPTEIHIQCILTLSQIPPCQPLLLKFTLKKQKNNQVLVKFDPIKYYYEIVFRPFLPYDWWAPFGHVE